MFSSTISWSLTSSRYFTSARRLLPCAAMSTRRAALDGRRDRLVPVGQEARDGVLQRLRQRQLLRAQSRVARIVSRVPLVVGRQRRRRDVVAAAPDLHLLLAVLRRGLRLVQPLQRAVVALVQPPVLGDRDPELIHLVERDAERLDRALQHRREREVEGVARRLSSAGPPRALPRAPAPDRSTSFQPVKRFSWFHVLWPCLSRTTLYMM